jgi:hypothetical protein
MPGFLVLDEESRRQCEDLARRVAPREHWYRPGESAIPGDLPLHCERVGTYRVVFSFTIKPTYAGPVRHLSVSNHDGRGYPAPEVVFTIAHWVGFTGARPDAFGVVHPGKQGPWAYEAFEETACVVVAEEVGSTTGRADA